jgi:thioredoxin 1
MAEVLEVNEQNFEEEIKNSDKAALLDFWAPWCGPCKMMHPIIESLAGEFEGRVVIARCNVDENPVLASQFEVTAIPTLVLLKGGEQVETMVGVTPPEEIKNRIESIL